MPLALFDLDGTLIDGDCVEHWLDYCMKNDILSHQEMWERNRSFMEQYEKGLMDIYSYIEFSMSTITAISINRLRNIVSDYIKKHIEDKVFIRAKELVSKHKAQGDRVLVISASPEFLVNPISALFGIEETIAITLKKENGFYCNQINGIAPYKEGKVLNLQYWLLKNNNSSMKGSYFYSDSHNDISLLEFVDNPVPTNPDSLLKRYADQHNWAVLSTKEQITPLII